MGRGGKDERRGYTAPRKPSCPGCGISNSYDYHKRGCEWARLNDPGRIRPLREEDLVGKKLTVVAADYKLLRFSVDGEPDEVYEVREAEKDDYTTDGEYVSYTEFEFDRISPEKIWPQPEWPKP